MSETRRMTVSTTEGRDTLVEERGDVKNWGIFFDWLTELWIEVDKKRQKEHNPYKQYMLNEEKAIIVAARRDYENFLSTIGDRPVIDILDISRPYLLNLEAKIAEVREKSKKVVVSTTIRDVNEIQKPDYIGAAYRGQIKVLGKIMNQFKGFRLETN